MNNSSGYISLWEPFFQTGAIFVCQGNSMGANIAFRFANINDHNLQQALAASPGFGPLAQNCDPPPAGSFRVSFLDDGNGFALNIVSQ